MENYSYEYENESEAYNNDINNLQGNHPNGNEMEYYKRLVSQGKCFKLPAVATLSDDLYQAWLYTFMSDVKDDVNEMAKIFRYTWCDEEENADADWVPYGIPGSVRQLTKRVPMKADDPSESGRS